jgi:8-oxo-dGTP pyrophosphatase MutT (NUDIX family)
VLTWEELGLALQARPVAQVDDPQADRAAVALVFREAGHGLELLFIRRAEHPRDPWSGQMAFPGGRAEPHERERVHTAIRETLEETGIDLGQRGVLLGALDELPAMARMRPMNLVVSPFVFRVDAAVQGAAVSEVVSVHWLPLRELLQARSTHHHDFQGTRLRFPCLHYEGLVIWGLTYRMLMGLVERVPGA